MSTLRLRRFRLPPLVATHALLALSAPAVAVRPLVAQGTTTALVATVTAHESGEPIAGAAIAVDGGEYRAETGENGRARIGGLAPGRHEVSTEAFGTAARRSRRRSPRARRSK